MESWELLSWNVKWVHVSVICELKTESSYALIWILEKQATNGNHDCTDRHGCQDFSRGKAIFADLWCQADIETSIIL